MSGNPAYDPSVVHVETVDYNADGTVTFKVETVPLDEFLGRAEGKP